MQCRLFLYCFCIVWLYFELIVHLFFLLNCSFIQNRRLLLFFFMAIFAAFVISEMAHLRMNELLVIGFKLGVHKRSQHDMVKMEKMDRIFKYKCCIAFLLGRKTSKYDGILKNAQNQLEILGLCIQDLKEDKNTCLAFDRNKSLHSPISSTTSPPIYAGCTFLICVVILYIQIIYLSLNSF